MEKMCIYIEKGIDFTISLKTNINTTSFPPQRNFPKPNNFLPNHPTMQNDKGQGISHVTDSSVPGKVQEKAPFQTRV
jgi:hypothetical protein